MGVDSTSNVRISVCATPKAARSRDTNCSSEAMPPALDTTSADSRLSLLAAAAVSNLSTEGYLKQEGEVKEANCLGNQNVSSPAPNSRKQIPSILRKRNTPDSNRKSSRMASLSEMSPRPAHYAPEISGCSSPSRPPLPSTPQRLESAFSSNQSFLARLHEARTDLSLSPLHPDLDPRRDVSSSPRPVEIRDDKTVEQKLAINGDSKQNGGLEHSGSKKRKLLLDGGEEVESQSGSPKKRTPRKAAPAPSSSPSPGPSAQPAQAAQASKPKPKKSRMSLTGSLRDATKRWSLSAKVRPRILSKATLRSGGADSEEGGGKDATSPNGIGSQSSVRLGEELEGALREGLVKHIHELFSTTDDLVRIAGDVRHLLDSYEKNVFVWTGDPRNRPTPTPTEAPGGFSWDREAAQYDVPISKESPLLQRSIQEENIRNRQATLPLLRVLQERCSAALEKKRKYLQGLRDALSAPAP